jgi:limonene-1,2-epoxide hydrolase
MGQHRTIDALAGLFLIRDQGLLCALEWRKAAMGTDRNKAVVRRYFSDMADKRSDKLIEELFTEDCVVHRPEGSSALRGREVFREAWNRVVAPYSEHETTIHEVVAENDLVVCRLSHRVVHRGGGWTNRIGTHAVPAGKVVTWEAMAMFRIRDGKIAEEWICRDELGMLMQLGSVASSK